MTMVTLGVADVAAARHFYEKGLGWKSSSKEDDGICFFRLGGVLLALYPWDKLAEDALVDARGEGFRGVTLAHNVRAKEEVAPILSLAEKAGGRIVKKAEDVFWGGHSGYFADPDGHLWEVAWNPFFEMNDRGEVLL